MKAGRLRRKMKAENASRMFIKSFSGAISMTKEQNRNMSYFFFLSSLVFLVFLIRAMLTQTGASRVISCLLFANLIFFHLRIAMMMYRKYKNRDLP
jgi:hypothetical protein